MKVYVGFSELLDRFETLPDSGWIGTKESFSMESDIRGWTFYAPENQEEDFDIEDNYNEFIEAPTFKDIVSNKREHHPNATQVDIIKAIKHYYEYDDFED